MSLRLSPTWPILALALAAGCPSLGAGHPPLNPAQVEAFRAREPQRATQACALLLQMRDRLGLQGDADFRTRVVSTSPEGRTVLRLQQMQGGLRVWGGEAIVHMDPDGSVSTLTHGVQPSVSTGATAPRLGAQEAQAIALANLAPKGPLAMAPKVERVVFPTRFTGGLATRFDRAKGRAVWDREMSIPARRPADPYVVAYEVRTVLSNLKDGHREMAYIIDADTGSILRKWDAVQSDRPAQGTGQSAFRGTVALDTTQGDDGTHALVSQARGSRVNPIFEASGVHQTGLTTCYGSVDAQSGLVGFDIYRGLPGVNTWGDGGILPFPFDFTYKPDPNDPSRWWGGMLLDWSGDGLSAWARGARTPTGETAAVDCHFGLSTTWDFYRNVFGRRGIDDRDTSTFGVVHALQAGLDGIYPLMDNAFWSPANFGMFFGEGTFGTPWAANSYGMKAITELDITGHELTHGVTEYSAGLIYQGQSGGLNEATSDILGKMVQAYGDSGGTGDTIPDFAAGDLTRWEVARNCVPAGMAPLRYLYKPSLDGASADGWFDGVDQLDVHFSSGPANRFFYFLTSGASSTPSSPTYSPYYPAGMTGIGNDKAARIYYKALTEYMAADCDFAGAREATAHAARDLFGAGSLEEVAVLKAWSAVNVGLAPGQAPRVKVTFPVVHGEGSFIDTQAQPEGILRKVQIFPANTRARIACTVENTANHALAWTTPSWLGHAVAGQIAADGTWTTPLWNYYEELLSVRATSQADPSQFAWTHVLLVNLDCDQDAEVDALDLGQTAMSWYGAQGFDTPRPSARIAGGGDWDLVFFGEAFGNGFPVK